MITCFTMFWASVPPILAQWAIFESNKLNSISFSINCTCQCEYSVWVEERLKNIVDYWVHVLGIINWRGAG